MWVTNGLVVDVLESFFFFFLLSVSTHTFAHRFNGFNSPLTWGFKGFPQNSALVTTTTYNYIKAPVRFPLLNLQIIQLFQIKTCKVLLQREG